MSVPFLGDARRAAESLMEDTVTVSRSSGDATTDDMTGEVTGSTTIVYTGRAKIQQSTAGAMGARVDAGELSTVLLRLEVHLPVVGSEGVARGDVVTVDSAANDAALEGRTFIVHDLMFKTHATARRLGVEEAT